MNLLDNLKLIKILDSGRVLESIEMLGEQFKDGWQGIEKLKISSEFKKIDKILLNGMGGSALGAQLVSAVFYDQLNLPLTIINNYSLPKSLNKDTLYIVCSYSGNTEEPLAEIAKAKKVGAKIFGITSGGQLADLIKQKEIAGHIFNPRFNPSAQPRLGLGYLLGIILRLFKESGILKINESKIEKVLMELNKFQNQFGIKIPITKNLAKRIALKLRDKLPVLVASEFLTGNVHTLANQLNETAKNFACYFPIPELNHHLMEGLAFPKTNQKNLCFVFFESGRYHPLNQKRYQITKKVLAKNKINHLSYRLQSKGKLSQAWEFLLFGSYLSFYLAILNGVNPAKIPFIDYFKKELGT